MWPVVRSTVSPGGTRYVHNELSVSGVALSPAGIVDVHVSVNGSSHSATRGIASPGLEEEHPSIPGAHSAGFELMLDTREWPRGARVVSVVAVDGEGRQADE